MLKKEEKRATDRIPSPTPPKDGIVGFSALSTRTKDAANDLSTPLRSSSAPPPSSSKLAVAPSDDDLIDFSDNNNDPNLPGADCNVAVSADDLVNAVSSRGLEPPSAPSTVLRSPTPRRKWGQSVQELATSSGELQSSTSSREKEDGDEDDEGEKPEVVVNGKRGLDRELTKGMVNCGYV